MKQKPLPKTALYSKEAYENQTFTKKQLNNLINDVFKTILNYTDNLIKYRMLHRLFKHDSEFKHTFLQRPKRPDIVAEFLLKRQQASESVKD